MSWNNEQTHPRPRAASRLVAALGLLTLGFMSGCADGNNDSCDPLCASTQECCDGTCVFIGMCEPAPMTDSGPVMRRDAGSTSMTCTTECTDMQRCCGGSCIQRSVPVGSDGRSVPSFTNCNGCGIACDMERASSCSVPGGGAGMARCLCGDFDQCLAGEVCVQESGSWQCISTSTDPNNCGAVGTMCGEGETCVGGVCSCGSTGAACAGGQSCCAGSCIDTASDAMNCGGCGVECGANAPDCNGGTCGCGAGPACREPMAGMLGGGGDPGESCCAGACTPNNNEHCGDCSTMCTGGDECTASGGLFGMGGGVEVCCLGTGIGGLLGCGGLPGGGDGGLPFPPP